MKRALPLVLLASLVGVSTTAVYADDAAPNSPLVTWQGSMTVTKVTKQCQATGFAVGNLLTSIYRARLDPAEPSPGFSVLSARGAATFFSKKSGDNTMAGTVTYTGTVISGHVTIAPSSSKPTAPTGTTKLTITPSKITKTTASVTITGTISNFFNTTGCTVTVTGVYALRPE